MNNRFDNVSNNVIIIQNISYIDLGKYTHLYDKTQGTMKHKRFHSTEGLHQL